MYNHRGEAMNFDKDGKRILNTPTQEVEDCFEVKTVSWIITGTHRATGEKKEFTVSSRTGEQMIIRDMFTKYCFI